MIRSGMNPAVDFHFGLEKKWHKELEKLRALVLTCGLTEELKWGQPCYTLGHQNILIIHGFKEYCALLFFKGALLKDTNDLLIQQTENVQAARQIRFTNVKEIIKLNAVLKTYIFQAIEVEKAGLKVKLKKTAEYPIPKEFKKALASNSDLKTAFYALTPGQQRGYILFFSAPKQSKTVEARIEKCIKTILRGKGLHD